MAPTLDEILDMTLTLADQRGWEELRLQDIARALDCPLQALSAHIREKEDLADAWFDRADQAMLAAAGDPMLEQLEINARLEHLLFSWLGALQPYHRVTRQMIAGKLEPGHLHVQIPSVLRISRTVQWLREAADCNAGGLRRALEETALTSLFVTAFGLWLRDAETGPNQARQLFRLGLRRVSGSLGWQTPDRPPALPAAQSDAPRSD